MKPGYGFFWDSVDFLPLVRAMSRRHLKFLPFACLVCTFVLLDQKDIRQILHCVVVSRSICGDCRTLRHYWVTHAGRCSRFIWIVAFARPKMSKQCQITTHQNVFIKLIMQRTRFRPRDPAGGSLRRSRRPSSRLGGGYSLDPLAFCVSLSLSLSLSKWNEIYCGVAAKRLDCDNTVHV